MSEPIATASATSSSVAAFGQALAAALAPLPGAVALKEAADGRIVWSSDAHAAIFGRGTGQMSGIVEADLLDAADAAALRDAEGAARAGRTPPPVRCRVDVAGRKRTYSVGAGLVGDVPGMPWLLSSVWVDTTDFDERDRQLAAALAQIEAQQADAAARPQSAEAAAEPALRDPATGLYQRPQFDDLLRREVDLSLREHREFALAAIELDAFAEDTQLPGEAAERRVLEALGRLLRNNTRTMDASCRLDGRRFAVLLSGVGLATAHSRMEGMRRQCATQIVVLDGKHFGFTVSMGVASFPHTASTQDELMDAAQAALEEAHRRGGNHVTLASIRFDGS